MSFRIIGELNGFKMAYRDPFTGDEMRDDLRKCQSVCFMLNDQSTQGEKFTIEEVKK